MAARIHIRIVIDEVRDLEPRPEWRDRELHVTLGPIHVVLSQSVAITLGSWLGALTAGQEGWP
jgi:hypothetical protein